MGRPSSPQLSAATLIAWVLLVGNPAALHVQTPDQIRTANQQISQLIELGEYSTALGFAEQVLQLAEQVFGKDDLETLESVGNLAEVDKKLGRSPDAVPLLKRILATRERVLGKDHPGTLASVSRLGLLFRTQAPSRLTVRWQASCKAESSPVLF
jgi:hypothetical protein